MNLPCARLNCSNCISYLLSHYLSLVSCLSISLFSSLDPSQCLLFIALLLFHYFLRYSPPFFVSLRLVLRCSPPSAVLLFAACRYPPSLALSHSILLAIFLQTISVLHLLRFQILLHIPGLPQSQQPGVDGGGNIYRTFYTRRSMPRRR